MHWVTTDRLSKEIKGNSPKLIISVSSSILFLIFWMLPPFQYVKKYWPTQHEMSLRDLKQISIERDISETSQTHLKRDEFFVTSLRLSNTSQKRCLFCNVFKTSQKHLKKDVFSVLKKDAFSVTSLWRLKNISRRYLWFFKNTPQKWFCVISVGLLQYLIK